MPDKADPLTETYPSMVLSTQSVAKEKHLFLGIGPQVFLGTPTVIQSFTSQWLLVNSCPTELTLGNVYFGCSTGK